MGNPGREIVRWVWGHGISGGEKREREKERSGFASRLYTHGYNRNGGVWVWSNQQSVDKRAGKRMRILAGSAAAAIGRFVCNLKDENGSSKASEWEL
ncbi:hypothetical protein COCNU_scaffold001464G000010 [Cocos nucifera]|nr:hypothetical protein [Cocos nucifera]